MQSRERNPKHIVIAALCLYIGLFLILSFIKVLSPEDNLQPQKLMLLFYILMFISMLLVVWKSEHKSWKELFSSLGFRKPTTLLIKNSLKYWIIALILLILLIILEDRFRSLFSIPQLEISVPANLEGLFNLIFSQIIIVGIVEESFFRGYLFQRIEVFSGRRQALLLSSILFGVFHLPEYIVIDPTNILIDIFYAFLTGIIFSALFVKTKHLYAPIVAHGLHNILLGYVILILKLLFP